jgi:hypothetical protein
VNVNNSLRQSDDSRPKTAKSLRRIRPPLSGLRSAPPVSAEMAADGTGRWRMGSRSRVAVAGAAGPQPSQSAFTKSVRFTLIRFDSLGFTRSRRMRSAAFHPLTPSSHGLHLAFPARASSFESHRKRFDSLGLSWIGSASEPFRSGLIRFDSLGLTLVERTRCGVSRPTRFTFCCPQPEERLSIHARNGLIYFDSLGFTPCTSRPSSHSAPRAMVLHPEFPARASPQSPPKTVWFTRIESDSTTCMRPQKP